jgi:hypothetical protein
MNRRFWIKRAGVSLGAVLAGAGLSRVGLARAKSTTHSGNGIVLYCDLAVIPGKEQQMLRVFHDRFLPAAAKFKGFVDLKILKYDHLVQGSPLAKDINYRFQLTYQSLALQQAWVNSATHKALWPLMAETLGNPQDFQVLVFNNA